jgi:hypothetical protein
MRTRSDLVIMALLLGSSAAAQNTVGKADVVPSGRPTMEVSNTCMPLARRSDAPVVPKAAVPTVDVDGSQVRDITEVEVSAVAVPVTAGAALPEVTKAAEGPAGRAGIQYVELPPVDAVPILGDRDPRPARTGP